MLLDALTIHYIDSVSMFSILENVTGYTDDTGRKCSNVTAVVYTDKVGKGCSNVTRYTDAWVQAFQIEIPGDDIRGYVSGYSDVTGRGYNNVNGYTDN